MSDIFQEVEEDVRRERYEQLWKKYGNYMIAAAAVVVLAVGGYQAWKAYDLNQRQQISDRYQAAQALAVAGTVVAAGAATSVQVGRRVVALMKKGAYGQLAVADEPLCAVVDDDADESLDFSDEAEDIAEDDDDDDKDEEDE